jgi:hypothetical protein
MTALLDITVELPISACFFFVAAAPRWNQLVDQQVTVPVGTSQGPEV